MEKGKKKDKHLREQKLERKQDNFFPQKNLQE